MFLINAHFLFETKIADFYIGSKYLTKFLKKCTEKEVFLPFLCIYCCNYQSLFIALVCEIICLRNDYSCPYSSHALIAMSSTLIEVNALMKAEARRSLVMRGTLKSMAARRIL